MESMLHTVPLRPRVAARVTGGVYLLFFATAILGEVFSEQAGVSGFGVSNDAGAVANSVTTHEAVLRLGFALGLFSVACYVVVTALFYVLFRPAGRSIALVAVFLSLIGQAVAACGSLLQVAPLVVLKGGSYLSAFSATQLQALALLFLHLAAEVGPIALLFDGLFLILIGCLVWRSRFLPRVLGIPLALAGLAWLIYLAPPLASVLSTYIPAVGFIAEAALLLWLLVVGVNDDAWLERARTAGLA